ncbi:hypothetical protein GGR57DRAFT_515824 [Xylariaceae sp. FL1272]|nr:hypothetical protein GGR57DRAFT_515824 [Xylariaceae sp. FL1272]
MSQSSSNGVQESQVNNNGGQNDNNGQTNTDGQNNDGVQNNDGGQNNNNGQTNTNGQNNNNGVQNNNNGQTNTNGQNNNNGVQNNNNGQNNDGVQNNDGGQNNNNGRNTSSNDQDSNGGPAGKGIKHEDNGFEGLLNNFGPLTHKTTSEPPSRNKTSEPGVQTIRDLESTPFPEPAVGGDDNYDSIIIQRDPDVKGKKVAVKGRIYCVIAFRALLLVLLPSLSSETEYSRAVLVKSSDARLEKARFLAKVGTLQYASDGSDLQGCEAEDFEPILVATDGSKSVTYCIGRVKGEGYSNLYSKSTLDNRFGKKWVDVLLNSRRELVGQGKIPREKRAKKGSGEDDEACQEYLSRFFQKYNGTPPPVLESE